MNKEFDFNEVGKRMPFRTPEGFFERMQAETLKRVAEEKRKKKLYRLKVGVSVALAMAAMICGFLFLPVSQLEKTEQATTVDWMAQLSPGEDAMDFYIQHLTDEELEHWMEFSENDIFYELTTQNLNEDEN
jgi:hypothetical protein